MPKAKQLTIGSFRVRAAAVQNDARGQSMRLVDLSAVSGEAMQAEDLPEGVTPADPSGQLRALVNPTAAKFLELDGEYDLVLVRRES